METLDWEIERLAKAAKWRCIQTDYESGVQYVDYHKVLEREDQEELNGALLVDHIIHNRFFPNGLPKIYKGVDANVVSDE